MSPPKRFGFARDLLQRLRGRLKEEVVHHAFVDERETRQWLGQREDEVDVADGQEFLLAGRDPRVTRGGQALGAMPVAAAVVREGRVCALLTAIAVPAERRGAALGDRPEDAPMLPGDPRSVRCPESDRHVGARCRPPRRVAGSPLAQPARAAHGVGRGDRHRIKRIGDGLQMPLRQVQIDDGVLEFDMTEQAAARCAGLPPLRPGATRTNAASRWGDTRLSNWARVAATRQAAHATFAVIGLSARQF